MRARERFWIAALIVGLALSASCEGSANPSTGIENPPDDTTNLRVQYVPSLQA